MKVLLTCVALVAALVLASAVDERVGWVEPSYADANEATAVDGASFLEDGTRLGAGAKGKVRGISHTVSGHHGMVTYISPARHIQTSGIVLTPPPTISVESVVSPVASPLYVQPIVMPHAEYHYAVPHAHAVHDHHLSGHHHHLPHLSDENYSVEHVIGHENGASEHVLAHAHADADAHAHGHHHHHSHRHHHHLTAGRVHIGSGVHAGDVHVHPYAPLAVPASLVNAPYHVAHYGHDSPVSQGAILVPHGPEGGIALEEADYAGYNPGAAIQYNTVPTSYYSDGTPHRASINQRFN